MHEREDTDISLKEVLLKVKEYVFLLWQKKWKILLCSLLMAIALTAYKWNSPPVYEAELTFMLNEDERGGLSGLSGLLGQFGLGMPANESNFDKILALSRARRITQDLCFEKAIIDKKEDYFANHLISVLEEFDLWQPSSLLSFLGTEDSLNLENFRFTHDSIEGFTLLENKALKSIHNIIAGTDEAAGRLKSSYDEYTGIMTFTTHSPSEETSIKMVNLTFEKLSEYYVDKAVEKQKYDYELIKNKYDSIYNRLNSVRSSLAYFEDSNKDLFRKRELLEKNKLKTEEQKLLIMVGKAEEQLQLAAITLENKTPYIQVIDRPIPPLKPVNKSIIYYIFLGLFLGGFFSFSYFCGVKIISEIMHN